MKKMNNRTIVGIDEAGRGPLAGPIAVGAFVVRDKKDLQRFKGVKDSKQLTENGREDWLKKIINTTKASKDVSYTVSFCSERVIDERGITHATYRALNRCLAKLEKKGFVTEQSLILMDGLLKAKSKYKNQKTIIDGDAKEPIIALASICAKVLRDRKMNRLSKLFPNYDFHIHKGYGTKAHYKAITKYGLSAIHRRSFLKNMVKK